MGVEIERRFILDKLPKGYDKLEHFEIEQGYYNNHKRLRIILRQDKRWEYWQAIKRGSGIEREEIQRRISRSTFDELWGKTKGKRLKKMRYLMPDQKLGSNLVFEIDKFKGKLNGHIHVEVEFRSTSAAIRFSPPKWFGKEVTNNKNYTGRSLATNGLDFLRK
jgi:adenylate cyclase